MVFGDGGSSAIALSMLSLVAGTFLLVKTCKEEMCCRWFPKIVAYVVIVISVLMILCGGYWRIVKWGHHGWGYGRGKAMMKGMSPEQMKVMMKDCPMMKMMQEKGGEEDE
jgi:hypothetical protein